MRSPVRNTATFCNFIDYSIHKKVQAAFSHFKKQPALCMQYVTTDKNGGKPCFQDFQPFWNTNQFKASTAISMPVPYRTGYLLPSVHCYRLHWQIAVYADLHNQHLPYRLPKLAHR